MSDVQRSPEAPRLSELSLADKLRCSRGLAVLASAICALSVTSSISAKQESRKASTDALSLVGFNDNDIWTTELQAARSEAKKIVENGGNAVRVFIPYTQGGAEVDNDQLRDCNAAMAAHENNLQLILTVNGNFKNGKLGYMPTSASELRKFETAMADLLWNLAGDDGGCVPDQKNIILSFMNESNNRVFQKNDVVNGVYVAGKHQAQLDNYVYPLLHTEANRPGLEVNLTIIGADIATSSRNAPQKFIKNMTEEGPVQMDAIAVHGYNPDASESVFNSGLLNSVKLIKQKFPGKPIYLTEIGEFSGTPPEKDGIYSKPLPASIKSLSGEQQGLHYQVDVQKAACLGIKAALIFHRRDDTNDPLLRTGIEYPDGEAKPSASIVEQTFQQALKPQKVSCD